ncbi:radical SAM protein [Arsenophonus sp.]|uniref:radical SAM/SPASM domain-containing protein n=1 Tax=Arsenophonus sp. TaxID=1872640 RepID=UPI00285A306D|nr:radical SAM protein [Arsenophonus sp.]MDR5617809.1 radical SAM protein [Arsenophonus sp.]MDR5617819.1 radical SAM protein [Arsenophonus sp.]MDR5617830.1 radical SAM protein [Arsenophonus sp.]
MKNGPWRITFDTNPDDCNLKCIMCEDHSPYSLTQMNRLQAGIHKRRMEIDLIRKILADSISTPLQEIIPSTMGEPLLYQHFDEIIALCHKYKIKLNLTTNGTFPRKSVERWAHDLIPITSDIKISWNGASKIVQEKIMLGSKWEKILNNLKKFIMIRNNYAKNNTNYCQITLQMTFLETNLKELENIVQLGINIGVDRIKGHHLWAHFKEIKSLSMRRNKESINRWNKAVIKAKKIANNNQLPNGNFIKLVNIDLLDESAHQDLSPGGVCPFLGKEAWVASDGKFNPCCAPDKERNQLGYFGNLKNQTMNSIWESQAYQYLQKNYMQYAVCKGCNMRKNKNF